jgi:hypothetical protein
VWYKLWGQVNLSRDKESLGLSGAFSLAIPRNIKKISYGKELI